MLKGVYVLVYLDAVQVNRREDGQVSNLAAWRSRSTATGRVRCSG